MSDLSHNELPKNYDPHAIEGPIFEKWYGNGYFRRGSNGAGVAADAEHAKPYTIVVPPPNVTGVLHMGHALNGTIQDILTRHARMQGRNTRWIVGTDHAGIATQNRVEKRLAKRGLTRFDVGREGFLDECWEWRREYGDTIISQFKAMGCSCDYDDEKFTMSPEYQNAIRHLFVNWYDRGLIYRGNRIINWCPRCTTALSDIEVEHEEQPEAGHLWHLRYPLTEPVGDRTYIVIATTRPETMLGDTAVAVNPDDDRYQDLVGKTVMLPLVDREIPIIADEYVDSSFGTGMVKITPAHDPNDFEVGLRHDLPQVNILNEDATIAEGFGEFTGLDRYEARDLVVKRFEEQGLLDHVDEHEHQPGHCYRCGTVVEPWLSDQWFVKMEPFARLGIEAVRSGKVSFTPERWDTTYYNWLENIRDWCISRQLWWGHRIPVYYCDSCGWEGASADEIDTCPECGAALRQDEDVLDTWFSSQLWPFATMGWLEGGEAEEELRRYYPTQVLSTAPDIMFLWVARMIMSSVDLLGEIPFEDVIYHPTVLDKNGDRMSKSKGNGIDPLDLIDTYGADAMRFHLASRVTGAQSFKLDPKQIENDRAFITKIWNAARFVQMNLEGYEPAEPVATDIVDRWILSRLAQLVRKVEDGFGTFAFNEIAHELYGFFWNEFCDWYVEFAKTRLYGDDAEERARTQANLVFILDNALRLLHPFMPFVTEEIWQSLPTGDTAPSLMVAAWPDADKLAGFVDQDAEHAVGLVCGIIGSVRNVRARYRLSPKQEVAIGLKTPAADVPVLEALCPLISEMGKVAVTGISEDRAKPEGSIVSLVGDTEVFIELADLVDFEQERDRLTKQRKAVEKDLAKVSKKLENPGYLAKAAQAVIDKDRAKKAGLENELAIIVEQLESLS
ncbi:MAG: valine--tRNA ligase [Actinomycetota bacterium]|nr:valine--tRNA ligase [Actinomycetota bacterium]